MQYAPIDDTEVSLSPEQRENGNTTSQAMFLEYFALRERGAGMKALGSPNFGCASNQFVPSMYQLMG